MESPPSGADYSTQINQRKLEYSLLTRLATPIKAPLRLQYAYLCNNGNDSDGCNDHMCNKLTLMA